MESLRKQEKVWRIGAEGEKKMGVSVKIYASVNKLFHFCPGFLDLF